MNTGIQQYETSLDFKVIGSFYSQTQFKTRKESCDSGSEIGLMTRK